MTEPLTIDRFRALADAYGGVVARWPECYGDVASRMMAAPDAAEILAQASVLDARLDGWRISAPSARLSARIAADAAVPARSLVSLARLWWSGIGIAAALAGAVAGSAAVAMAAPVDTPMSDGTSFGEVAGSDG